MEFKAYHKSTPTLARLLTQKDYDERNGVIETSEGPKPFAPGDYLAHDAKGEWPIKRKAIQEKYTRVALEDEHGFAPYLRLGTNLAAPMPEPFRIQGLTGKAGDYLVIGNGSGWPVDREIFEQTYVLDN